MGFRLFLLYPFAATLTIVFVGSFIMNWLTFTCCNLSSISDLQCNVVVIVSSPSSPLTVVGAVPFLSYHLFHRQQGWYYSLLNCWFFRFPISSNRCWSYLTCFESTSGSGINHIATFGIFRLFNLSFRTNFNDCLTCWGDDWITNVFCDMTVL